MPTMTRFSKRPVPDIIIVGGGLSGICAAVAAAENGASVTVLDRAYGGGASAISAGVIYAGGGTRQQKEAGYGDDTPENMYEYLRHEVGDAVDATTLKRFCADSVPNLQWLESHGAEFGSALCPYKTSLPKPEYDLYFSGNEKEYPFATISCPAPRGHRPTCRGPGGRGGMGMTGADLWQAMFNSALLLGVQFEPASRVEEVLMDDHGQVKGVRYHSLTGTTRWATRAYKWLSQTALQYQSTIQPLSSLIDWLADLLFLRVAHERELESQAVVLAAGGFISTSLLVSLPGGRRSTVLTPANDDATVNETMVRKFIPWAEKTAKLGTAGDDGSGIRLGQAVGGSVSHMNRMSAWRLLYPPEALLEGIIISLSGERIAAEDLYGGSFTDAMIDKAGGQGFLILDSAQWDKVAKQIQDQTHSLWRVFVYFLVFCAYQKADSLEGLAQKIKVNGSALTKTVDAYNIAIKEGEPDPVGKLNYRSVLGVGPFYAIDVSLRSSGLLKVPALTLGGLRVDGASGMVLDKTGHEITGLYAAGRNAVGICSNNYISGLSIADCVFSGRRAGGHASRVWGTAADSYYMKAR